MYDSGGRQGAGTRRYLLVVRRDAPAVLVRAMRMFAGDDSVDVIEDRRETMRRPAGDERRQRLDFWEDLRHHDMVLVPRSEDVGDRACETGQAGDGGDAVERERGMETANVVGVEGDRLLEQWLEQGQLILGRIIPTLLEERGRLRQRAEAAERECERLRAEARALQTDNEELNRTADQSRRAQAEMADVLTNATANMARALEPMHQVLQRLR